MAVTLRNEIRAQFARALHTKTIARSSKWAEKCRIMGAPFPGPYSFKYHPWCKEIHDCMTPEVVTRKGAQTGLSESFINIGLSQMDQKHLNVFYVLPTTSPDAENFSTERIGRAIELSPYIKNMFTRTLQVGLKATATNTMYIRGAKSKSQLRSIDTAIIIADEVDLFPEWALPLLRKRDAGQLEGTTRLIGGSTPSIPGTGVDAWFLESTQEMYSFRCPHCQRFIHMEWPGCIKITAESPNDPNITHSHYVCTECQAPLGQDEKLKSMRETGQWIAARTSNIRGFQIGEQYTYTMTAPRMAKDYLRGLQDPYYEQEFYNSNLGLPHAVDSASLADKDLIAALGQYKLGDFASRQGIRTMGVDVGKELHYVVKHWKTATQRSEEINECATGHFIAIGKAERFLDIDKLIARYQPHVIVVDINPETREAKSLALRHPNRVFLCFYGRDAKERAINLKPQSYLVSAHRTSWLDLTLNRYRNGTCFLPLDVPLEFKQHLMALVRSYKLDKERKRESAYYKSTGPDHYAHADNYAEIALNLTAQLAGSSTNLNIWG